MFLFLWFHLSSVCGDMRFTNDKPKDSIKASLGDNVPLRWTFTYNDDAKKIQLAHGVLGECTKSSLASGNLHMVKSFFSRKL